MSIQSKSFGLLPDGREATLYTLTNASGASVDITNYGGILVALRVPDRSGALTDVLLGCKSAADYVPNHGYLGALIGRVGNRIAGGRCIVNGQTLQLACNEGGKNHLHGGNLGFNQKIWDVTPDEARNALVLKLVSPDGEENYPGTLNVTVTYTWDDSCALGIRYQAVSDQDTLCNLTNHAYFNLSGEGSGTVLDHEISICADAFTAVKDAECIPTGELRPVEGTPLDLRQPVRIGDGIEDAYEQMRFGKGYDHNFVLNGSGMRKAAEVYSAASGICMEVETDQPGIQFYSGNGLGGKMPGKCGHRYQNREGLCLETQYFPDSVNHPNFPDSVLRAGQAYDFTTVYRFGVR